MFVWTSGFQKSLAHTDFNMFVDEWTSANESPTLSRGSLSGGSLSRGVSQGDPRYGYMRAVRILLGCILVVLYIDALQGHYGIQSLKH